MKSAQETTQKRYLARLHPLAALMLAISPWALSPASAQQQGPDTAPVTDTVADTASETVSAPVTPPPVPEGSVGGMGDINLYPKRVVINGARQIATVGLYNKSVHEGDYEIKIVDMMMTPEGQLVPIKEGDTTQASEHVAVASRILRYSPRRVTLMGSESQTIRIMARAPSSLPAGEYRSHFMAISVPREQDQGFSIEDAAGGATPDRIGVTIRPRFGISIPVIVRIGKTTLETGIRDPQILTARDGSRALSLTLTRLGTRSAFGDINVTARGADQPVAIARGIGIYPELKERTVIIPLNPQIDPHYLQPGTSWKITYIDDDFAPGTTLAEHEFIVP